ncbi:MAG: glycosyltransferase [bacterium]
MIKQRDFIVFSDDWGRLPFSCQHIMKHFLNSNRIAWVNTIGMRSPKLTAYDVKRSFEKLRMCLSSGSNNKHYHPNLTILNPFIIPYNHISAIRFFNKNLVVKKVKNVMLNLGIKKPIVLTTFPNAVDYIHAFEEIADIYYCVDDFTNWPGVNQDLVRTMEEKLLDECDLVLATSKELCLKKERKGKKPVLLPHGVDFDHFRSGYREDKMPETLRGIPKPIIGFFGTISPWLDFDLMIDMANARPDWSFVFLGPADTDIKDLAKFGNVYFVGKVPYEALPEYAVAFDVATIPFLVNELTVSVNPLKILEYLACGLPVVTTNLPEIRKFSDLVYIADGPLDFIENIKRALSENSEKLKARRIEEARKHSWGSVAENFSLLIEKLYPI